MPTIKNAPVPCSPGAGAAGDAPRTGPGQGALGQAPEPVSSRREELRKLCADTECTLRMSRRTPREKEAQENYDRARALLWAFDADAEAQRGGEQ